MFSEAGCWFMYAILVLYWQPGTQSLIGPPVDQRNEMLSVGCSADVLTATCIMTLNIACPYLHRQIPCISSARGSGCHKKTKVKCPCSQVFFLQGTLAAKKKRPVLIVYMTVMICGIRRQLSRFEVETSKYGNPPILSSHAVESWPVSLNDL